MKCFIQVQHAKRWKLKLIMAHPQACPQATRTAVMYTVCKQPTMIQGPWMIAEDKITAVRCTLRRHFPRRTAVRFVCPLY